MQAAQRSQALQKKSVELDREVRVAQHFNSKVFRTHQKKDQFCALIAEPVLTSPPRVWVHLTLCYNKLY